MNVTSRSYSPSLEGLTAIVTAAGAGIGKASAVALAENGARIIAIDVNDASLGHLEAQFPTMHCVHADVTDPVQLEKLKRSTGNVEILVNCAGRVAHGTVLDFDDDEWSRDWQLNVVSMARLTKLFLPSMVAKGSGSIINISSVVSSNKGAANRCLYGTTKAAVIGLTKSIAFDFVTHGVRCNAICPGTIATPSLDDRIAALGDPTQVRAGFVARQPMGRLGTPEEIAALVVYLASPAGAFSTGQTYIIDGGWSL